MSYDHKDLHIILDLDNTLINSLDPNERKNAPRQYQNKFKHVKMDNYYTVFERPYLQKFLDYIFDNYKVSVFTAADNEYALFIIEKIILTKPDRKLEYIFTGPHSSISEMLYNSPKNLKMLWDNFKIPDFSHCNTIIIDDLNEVKESNPYNSIQVKAFELLEKKKEEYIKPSNEYMEKVINDHTLFNVITKLEYIKAKLYMMKCDLKTVSEKRMLTRL